MWWKEKRNVSAVRVVDDGPGQVQEIILVFGVILSVWFFGCSQVLYIESERSIRMVQDETAVHLFQKVELALQDMSDAIGELLRIGVRELVLHNSLTCLNETIVGYDSKFLDLRCQENTCRR